MAKNTEKHVSKIKIKKKIWCKILAPKLFGNKEIGETFITHPEVAVGRKLSINLRDITGNIKDQYAAVQFVITNFNGTTLHTEAIGYITSPAYVKRAVRKNTDRLDDYFVLTCRDGKKVVVKTLIITRNCVQRSTQTSLRNQLKAFLVEESKKTPFDLFLGNTATRKLLLAAKKKLHKLCPTKEVAIRILQLKNNGMAIPMSEGDAAAVAEEVAGAEENTEEQDSEAAESTDAGESDTEEAEDSDDDDSDDSADEEIKE